MSLQAILAMPNALAHTVMLAGGVFKKGELKKRDASGLNFNTQNAIDYFGPPKLNQPYQQSITGASSVPSQTIRTSS